MGRKASTPLRLFDSVSSDPPDRVGTPLSPLEIASFIENMTAELRLMARGARLDALSYFLEMARIEASAQIEQIATRR